MPFVSVPAPPALGAPDAIGGDDWFPPVRLADVRDVLRVGGTTVTDARLIEAIVSAMASVRRELRAWQRARILEGHAGLEDVDDDAPIGGLSALVLAWRRAVHGYAAADLVETHSEISATADGRRTTEVRTLTADEHRRNAIHAIRDILGVTRTAVELI